jgi:hypothetical protein
MKKIKEDLLQDFLLEREVSKFCNLKLIKGIAPFVYLDIRYW